MTGEDLYGVREAQETYLTMLRDFDAFCRTHAVDYSLSGGTMLGAARHRGFIPWDDDADVMFDRANYEKFLSAAGEMSGYEILGRRWTKRLAKIDPETPYRDRICLDLFVFDGIPESPLLARTKLAFLLTLQGMLKVDIDYGKYALPQKLMVGATHLFGCLFTRGAKQRAYERISRWGGDDTRFVNVYNTRFDQVRTLRFPREILSGYEEADFEGERFMVIRGWKKYLTVLYGDYMQLPPEEQRRGVHRQHRKGEN